MPNTLGPWEPDAEHPTTEVRRTRAGTLDLPLIEGPPEGASKLIRHFFAPYRPG